MRPDKRFIYRTVIYYLLDHWVISHQSWTVPCNWIIDMPSICERWRGKCQSVIGCNNQNDRLRLVYSSLVFLSYDYTYESYNYSEYTVSFLSWKTLCSCGHRNLYSVVVCEFLRSLLLYMKWFFSNKMLLRPLKEATSSSDDGSRTILNCKSTNSLKCL